jgi:hypothetical protein
VLATTDVVWMWSAAHCPSANPHRKCVAVIGLPFVTIARMTTPKAVWIRYGTCKMSCQHMVTSSAMWHCVVARGPSPRAHSSTVALTVRRDDRVDGGSARAADLVIACMT